MNIQTRDGRIRDESEAAQAVSKAIALDALRARLRALEVGSTASPIETAVPFGVSEVDSLLPWGGLPVACLHEVLGDGTGAGEGFCAMLKARLSAIQRPALWCLARADLHAPGLGTFGLVPDRLIIVRGRSAGDVAWAMEEGLRSGCVGAVLGELRALDLRAGRRLQLAARAGGVTCLVLRRNEERLMPGVAVTRWRIVAAPSRPEGANGNIFSGTTRWRVELLRCRGAVPRRWLMEWDDEAHRFGMASLLAERTSDQVAAPGRAG